jgi:hypothetical protein
VPVLLALGLVLAILALGLLLMPVMLVQRYRVGTSRQQARGWLLTLNVAGLVVSVGMFLTGALLSSVWIPNALAYSLGGLAVGGVLGIAGLRLTRWEPGVAALHYTPNRLLVLTLTLVITARLLYGFWRAWHTWGAVADRREWLVAAGAAESLAAGAVVLGYYLVYWVGVRRRQRQHARRALRRL